MTTAVDTTVLDALRIEVPVEMERRNPAALIDQGRCVQATRVGIEALRYFGFEARPLTTLMMCGNAAWVEWMANDNPMPMPDEVWSVGIDPVAKGRGFPAHLVLALGSNLLDLDAGLYARPHKGIHIPSTLMLPLLDQEEGLPIAGAELDEGGAIIYGRPRTWPDFYGSGAWKNTQKWAGPVIRRMRDRLEVER